MKKDFFAKKNNDPQETRNREWNVSRIRYKSVGEILEETRQEQNLTIEKAARSINVHYDHLRALESGDYSKLPGGVYSEKILEAYADFLNIDFKSLKNIFDKENRVIGSGKKQTFVRKISQKNFIVTPRLLEIAAAVIAVIFLLIYLGFEVSNIFSPPSLNIESPADNLVVFESSVEIIGRTEKETKVKINDQEIQTDAQGNFKELIVLQPGLNIIKISSAKKRSKENIIYKQIILNKK